MAVVNAQNDLVTRNTYTSGCAPAKAEINLAWQACAERPNGLTKSQGLVHATLLQTDKRFDVNASGCATTK